MVNTEKEQVIWKIYPDYPFLQVNQFGEVRTKDRITVRKNGTKYHTKGRILKQWENNMGYMYVKFSVDGKTVKLYVHRMVATCFIPNPKGYPEVNHKDNNPKNNVTSNLEWCTKQYNLDYKKNFGTSPAQIQGTPVIAINLETSKVFYFESQSEAGRQLSANPGHINNVISGKRNKTHGFWFCYADENAVENTRVIFGNDVARKVEELIRENYN